MKLQEMLRGFTAFQPQVSGNMAIVPLASQEALEEVRALDNISLSQDNDYSLLTMRTNEPSVTIMPMGTVYITKENAQDRVVPSAHVMKGEKQMKVFCVQSSQSGHMRPGQEDQREIRLLPRSLRRSTYAKRHEGSYSHIWDDLAKYNAQVGVRGNFIISFYQKYQSQLEQFVAEFETIKDQRGCLIFINNTLAGIEIMPNSGAFESFWEPLVRDCYGSEAIRLHGEAKPLEASLMKDVDNLVDLPAAVEDCEKAEKEWAKAVIESLFNEDVNSTREENLEGYELLSVDTPAYEGQVVMKEGMTVYLSLLSKPLAARALEWR